MHNKFLLSVLISVCIIYLGVNLKQVWSTASNLKLEAVPPPAHKQNKPEKEDGKKVSKKIAAFSSYKIIGDKNMFRPERREWTAPPAPPPPPPLPVAKIVKPPPPPPPPPLPEPTLLGIIIDEDSKIALMQGHTREEIVTPQRRTFRNPRFRAPKRYNIKQEPMGRYHVGDTISEANIIKILNDRVVLERDGAVFQILLRGGKKKRSSSSNRSTPSQNRNPFRRQPRFPR